MKKSDEESKCVFCEIMASSDDEANLVVHRAEYNYLVLNRYPYITAHLMVVPYRHIAEPTEASEKELSEMMALASLAMETIKLEYQPQGFNMGMNVGRSAGAGIAEHLPALHPGVSGQ